LHIGETAGAIKEKQPTIAVDVGRMLPLKECCKNDFGSEGSSAACHLAKL
jgi:hypothetical protein